MKEYLLKIDNYIKSLDKGSLDQLSKISVLREFKKNDFLLIQDNICKYSFFIKQGGVRKFYLFNGKEYTTQLLFENEIAVSFNSYTLQIPSNEYIQALMDTVVLQTDYVSFQKAKETNQKLIQLDLLITEYYTLWLENRFNEFQTLDASQRYLQLLNNHHKIIKTIPLTIIASYLGISLETLSRIRANLKNI